MGNLSKFSETLKGLMSERSLTETELANETEIQVSCISLYTNAKHMPTIGNLIKIADYFECSADYLLGLSETDNTSVFNRCPPFSERIEYLLKHYNCTISSIVDKTQLSRTRFFEWKNGKRQPSVDNVILLAEHFDCSVDFILGRV